MTARSTGAADDRRSGPASRADESDAARNRDGRPLDVIEKWEATILGRGRPRSGGRSDGRDARPRRGERT